MYLKGVVWDFGHRTSFPSEPVCYLSLETVFNTFHSVLLVAEIAGARLGVNVCVDRIMLEINLPLHCIAFSL